MFKYALTIVCLALAVQAKSRNSRLPQPVWNKNPMLRSQINERIVGGDEVVPHSIPFQVSLQYDDISFHFCGGSIANADTIITAGHCCEGQFARDLVVVVGEHNLFTVEGTEQTLKVREVIMHPDYNSCQCHNIVNNDICVLKLAEPINLNENAAAVTLPEPYQAHTGEAVVSGWGTLFSGGSSPATLQSVTVPIKSDTECRNAYGQSKIANSMICAGQEGKGSCQGDSGGPMTCNGDLCGVVSWGYGCAMAEYPNVYTQVSYFVDWLKSQM